MDYQTLIDGGASFCGGQIDFRNRNIGVCTDSGPQLTPDGLAFFKEHNDAPAPEPLVTAVKTPRKPKVKAPEPVLDDEDLDLSAELDRIL